MSNNKQSIKLYTEEQVREILKSTHIHTDNDVDMILPQFTPIELPSDEEIVNQSKYIAHNYFEMHHTNHYQGLEEGSLRMASWMRDKIQGGNNESN